MYRMFMVAIAAGVALVGLGVCATAADEKKEVTIKEVMKAHGETGLRQQTIDAVKAKKWDEAEKTSKTWLVLAQALGKAKPKKGGAESWKTKTTNYAKLVKNIAEAAEKKDATKAANNLRALNTTCGACHKIHK